MGFGEGQACYVCLGSRAMIRQGISHLPLAVVDTFTPGIDSGFPPPQGSPLAFDASSIRQTMDYGLDITLGCRWCDGQAIEVSGFYMPKVSKQASVSRPGQLDGLFLNNPVNFEGDAGLWLQADRMVAQLESTIGSAEINYRCSPVIGYGLDLLVGVRYFYLRERFSVITDDDGLTTGSDPTNVANYSVVTKNQIAAVQIGVDWEHPITRWLAFGWYAKAAGGANFLQVDVSLTRGDGLPGPEGSRRRTQFGYLFDGGLYLDWFICERARLRGGYNALLVGNVADAPSQLSFDLSSPIGQVKNTGTIFYHGPSLSLHLLF
jgi:hypothetical protein